jgi:hypothetical protein
MPTLQDILLKDAENAKIQDFESEVLAPGEYTAKIIGFVEEETYQYVTVEIDKKRYNLFYNYYLYGTTDLDGNLINWIKALATIPTTAQTSLLEIANSAIGSSYKITVYNYIGKSGKNAGKTQHAISFRDAPVIQTVTITEEELDLPF